MRTNLSEVIDVTAILVEIFLGSVGKHSWGIWTKIDTSTEVGFKFARPSMEYSHGRISIFEAGSQTTWRHLLESKRESTINDACLYQVIRLIERGASRGAIVVHIGDGNTSHAKVIKSSLRLFFDNSRKPEMRSGTHLTTGRVPVAVPNKSGLNRVIRYSWSWSRIQPDCRSESDANTHRRQVEPSLPLRGPSVSPQLLLQNVNIDGNMQGRTSSVLLKPLGWNKSYHGLAN
jgi:hypothetical protein